MMRIISMAKFEEYKKVPTKYVVVGRDWDNGYMYKHVNYMLEGYLKE